MIAESPEPLPPRPGEVAPFKAGQWLVEPSLNRAGRDGRQVQLQPRIMHVLVCLAARPGKVVSRDALLDTVWQDAVVCEDALTRTISELRRLFEDDPQEPRFIETIRKGGYRLLVPVSPVDAPAAISGTADEMQQGQSETSGPPRAPSGRLRLAILGVTCFVVVIAIFTIWMQQAYTSAPEQPETLGTGSSTTLPEQQRFLRTRPFTSYQGSESDPAVSPDGTRVAFVWDHGKVHSYGLYVKQWDTETPLRLTRSGAVESHPTWSPDGSAIAFAGRRDGQWGIFTVPAIGGPERRLIYAASRITGLDWSPDGRTLVYTFTYDGWRQPCLMLFDMTTGEARALTEPVPPNMCDHKPAFSPDGRQIAFLRYGGQFHEDIHVVSVDGGEVRAITERQRWITGLDWTPDGSRVIFSAAPEGRYRLWEVPAVGGPVTWLSTTGEMVRKPSLALHADCLVFEELDCDYDIWTASDRGPGQSWSQSESLISSTRMDYNPHISPDGKSITFLSTRSGSREVWACDSDGSRPRQLTRFGDRFLSSPRWSPDGRQIAFSSNPDEDAAVFILDPATGESRRIGDPEQYAWFCDWSPDGKWIYFVSDSSGDRQIWRMTPNGTNAEQVTRDGGVRARAALDGRSIWYCRYGQSCLWRVDLESGEEECAIEPPEDSPWICWELADGAIFHMTNRTDHYLIARYDLETGETRKLSRTRPHSNPSLAVSPDGRTILFKYVERLECDLVLARLDNSN